MPHSCPKRPKNGPCSHAGDLRAKRRGASIHRCLRAFARNDTRRVARPYKQEVGGSIPSPPISIHAGLRPSARRCGELWRGGSCSDRGFRGPIRIASGTGSSAQCSPKQLYNHMVENADYLICGDENCQQKFRTPAGRREKLAPQQRRPLLLTFVRTCRRAARIPRRQRRRHHGDHV
jgi:hypothetical protein